MTAPPPRRISDRVLEVSLTGYLCLYESATMPLRLNMPGTSDEFVVVFSTKQKLDAFMREYGLSCFKIVQITDGVDFLQSVMAWFRVCIDPHKHENGRTRYTEP